MLEKGQISSTQLYMLSLMIILGTSILFVPGITISMGGRDAWLAPILGGGLGLIVMFVMIQLNRYFPAQTPVEYLQTLFGKWLGRVFAAYLLWVLLRYYAAILREAADFTITAALNRTPPEIVILLMVLVVHYVARQGIEVIARFTQFVVIVELIQLVASVVLLASKDIDLSHLTPLFEKGFLPLLRSSFVINTWFGELMITGFLLPFIRVKHGTVKAGVSAVASIVVLLIITNFYTLGVFGDVLAARMEYGLYEVARYISIAEFLERLDPIVMGTWIMLMFCKLTIFCYVTSLGLAQLLKFSDYRPMVSLICVIAFTMSEQMFVNVSDMTAYFLHVQPFFGLLFTVIAPTLILCFAAFRSKRRGLSA